MSRHTLQNRSESELLWYQRRSFLSGAAGWLAAGGFGAAQAQARSNIVELIGDARLNGERLRPEHTIQTGDDIATGPGSSLVFVVGNSSFRVRQNTRMAVERGPSLFSVSVLRLLAGGVVSVWGAGSRRQIVTPTLTAGIRGTGVYTEVLASQGGRSYFCNCYGEVEMESGNQRALSQASSSSGERLALKRRSSARRSSSAMRLHLVPCAWHAARAMRPEPCAWHSIGRRHAPGSVSGSAQLHLLRHPDHPAPRRDLDQPQPL